MIEDKIHSGFFPDIAGGMEQLEVPVSNHDWFFIAVSGVLVIIAFARNFAPRRFRMIFGATASIRKLEGLRDEGKVFFNGSSMALFIASIAVLALYAYNLHFLLPENVMFLKENPYLMLLGLLAAFAVLWLIKDLFILGIGNIFKAPVSGFLNVINKYVINVLAALVLLVFVVLAFYLENNIFLYIPAYLIALLYIYRLIRTFIIGRKVEGFFSFYIILYLCTLEILPVLFLYKVIERYVEQSI